MSDQTTDPTLAPLSEDQQKTYAFLCDGAVWGDEASTHAIKCIDELRQRVASLTAENARLREALDALTMSDEHPPLYPDEHGDWAAANRGARRLTQLARCPSYIAPLAGPGPDRSIVMLADSREALRREVARLTEDRERIEWLEQQENRWHNSKPTVREALDAARREDGQ